MKSIAPICLALVLASAMAPESAQASQESPAAGQVSEISIPMPGASPELTTRLTVKFNRAVTSEQAENYRSALKSAANQQAPRTIGPAYLSCDGSGNWSDQHGTWSLQYTCTSAPYLNWGYQLSPAVTAFVDGPVSEQGLQYWVNGAKRSTNSPHVEGARYHFHGTMSNTPIGSTVKYWDYYTFRHHIGPGGTANLVVEGQTKLLRD